LFGLLSLGSLLSLLPVDSVELPIGLTILSGGSFEVPGGVDGSIAVSLTTLSALVLLQAMLELAGSLNILVLESIAIRAEATVRRRENLSQLIIDSNQAGREFGPTTLYVQRVGGFLGLILPDGNRAAIVAEGRRRPGLARRNGSNRVHNELLIPLTCQLVANSIIFVEDLSLDIAPALAEPASLTPKAKAAGSVPKKKDQPKAKGKYLFKLKDYSAVELLTPVSGIGDVDGKLTNL
jgi:hypothetical protein